MMVRAVRQARAFLPWLAAALVSLAALPSSAEELVHFQNPQHQLTLAAYLSRPPGDGPAPAVVMLHGCSGLVASERPTSLYRDWRDAFVKEGFVVLMVDSASSRGFGQTCTAGEARKRMWAERPSDAYAALAFLQAQPFIDPARVSLGGWSQGGGVVLSLSVVRAVGGRTRFRPMTLRAPSRSIRVLAARPYSPGRSSMHPRRVGLPISLSSFSWGLPTTGRLQDHAKRF